ncbi:acyl-CoA dehydrogenase family protein [Pseudonocardia acidicola]|uniref:Acyl-CoA/acyl-ACP dehydrogenase n=1 Tax=Pseudonocardia acidicola TaxID=2724939 RepID=A0ABX1SDF0_9PSEU|nr:acyl-CoA/acyl-ACP dehydrogenase [Pseudonocardia acidicola]
MDLALSEEQNDFRGVVAEFLADRLGDGHAREFVDHGGQYDAGLWKSMAGELGLAGLAVEEELGGSGAGLVELALVLEEAGRAQLCAPLFATTALALPVLLAAPAGEARSELLTQIASGETTATAVFDAVAPAFADGRLDGTVSPVVDGATADLIVLPARNGDETVLVAVRRAADTVRATTLEALDPTRPLAEVTFASAAAHVLARGAEAETALRRARATAIALLAAEQLGGLQGTLDLAAEYARSRVQFDRPIGGFQAVKHRLADMYVDLELSRWTVYVAAGAFASGPEDPAEAEELAATTRAVVSEAFQRSTASLLQVLGGIGYTWEHPAHLQFKRAAASARLLGTIDEVLDAVADRIGL